MSSSASEYGDNLSFLRKVWEYADSKFAGFVYRCRTKKIGMYNGVAVRNRRLVTPRDEIAESVPENAERDVRILVAV